MTKAELVDKVVNLRDTINAKRVSKGEAKLFLMDNKKVLLKETTKSLEMLVQLYNSILKMEVEQ